MWPVVEEANFTYIFKSREGPETHRYVLFGLYVLTHTLTRNVFQTWIVNWTL